MISEILFEALNAMSHGLIGVCIILLTEFRNPVKLWRRRWLIWTGAVMVLNVVLCPILGIERWRMFGLFIYTLPYTAITFVCSKYRDLRIIFCFCTCLWIICIVFTGAMAAFELSGRNEWVRLAVMYVLYIIFIFVTRAFSPYYRRITDSVDRGWGILCLIPSVTFLTVVIICVLLLPSEPEWAAKAIFAVTLICSFTYIVVQMFASRVMADNELKTEADINSVRLAAMRRQIEETERVEEEMRSWKAEMAERWGRLLETVENSDLCAARKTAEELRKKLDDVSPARFCRNSMINAVVSAYISKAERAGIETEVSLDIPEKLPADNGELAMVFANALENAVNACLAVPKGRRRIVCRCVSSPAFMLSVENTYSGAVSFDGDGMPVSNRDGHGTGTRSIRAFCEKYDALCSYKARDGMFFLRLSL